MATKAKKDNQVSEWMYDIVRHPMVTEKTTLGSQHGQVTFRVPLSATKPQIKQAIEALFGVNVVAVNTLINKGKTKRFKGVKAFRSDTKKAMITLKDGQTIDAASGV
jgi:large subunit ribosomal protein L23